jgi:hypothetical protein
MDMNNKIQKILEQAQIQKAHWTDIYPAGFQGAEWFYRINNKSEVLKELTSAGLSYAEAETVLTNYAKNK